MKGGNELTKEELGQLILSSERQLYATAKTILADDQDCADAIQESIVKAFTKIIYHPKQELIRMGEYEENHLSAITAEEESWVESFGGQKRIVTQKHG